MIIYKVTNKINRKSYIGKTKNLKRRIYDHLRKVENDSNTSFHNALRKNGKENFEWVEIDHSEYLDILNLKEEYWISYFNTKIPTGYNLTNGGEGGDTFSMNPNKEKTRKLLSIVNAGENNNMYGKKCLWVTERNRKNKGKTYEKIYGKEKAEKIKSIMSDIHKGQIQWNKGLTKENDIRVKKISESRIGEKNPMYGKTGEKSPFFGKKRPEHSERMKGNQYAKKKTEI